MKQEIKFLRGFCAPHIGTSVSLFCNENIVNMFNEYIYSVKKLLILIY